MSDWKVPKVCQKFPKKSTNRESLYKFRQGWRVFLLLVARSSPCPHTSESLGVDVATDPQEIGVTVCDHGFLLPFNPDRLIVHVSQHTYADLVIPCKFIHGLHTNISPPSRVSPDTKKSWINWFPWPWDQKIDLVYFICIQKLSPGVWSSSLIIQFQRISAQKCNSGYLFINRFNLLRHLCCDKCFL